MTIDPIWNDPDPVLIRGNKFVCREVPYPLLRGMLKRLGTVLSKLKGFRDGQGIASPEAATAVAASSLPELLEDAANEIEAIVLESTGITVEVLQRMPAGAYLELATKVLEGQKAVVAGFFGLGPVIEELFGGPEETNGSSKLKSSPPSVEEVLGSTQ